MEEEKPDRQDAEKKLEELEELEELPGGNVKKEQAEKSISEDKKELRKRLRKLRREFKKDYCREADSRIMSFVMSLPQYRQASLIFCYVSAGDEIDTKNLLAAALGEGKRAAVPRCLPGRAGEMEACEISSLEELRPGAYGILEPIEGCPVVPPEQISLCVVPCLSADPATGVRLGYGGGYYDRYLERTGAFRAVLCREKSLYRGLPREIHDLKMDALITEKGVILYERSRL